MSFGPTLFHFPPSGSQSTPYWLVTCECPSFVMEVNGLRGKGVLKEGKVLPYSLPGPELIPVYRQSARR